MMVGYARVSTDGQALVAQRQELIQAGCEKIFEEKLSGAHLERPELLRLLKRLQVGDTLVVCRLDRLARSSRDLLNVLHEVGERGANFRSLRDAWADTGTAHGKLMIAVLAGLAEFERSLIRSRTSEGRDRARKDGRLFGRRPKLTTHQRREAWERRRLGESTVSIARSFNVSHSTISRLVRKMSPQA